MEQKIVKFPAYVVEKAPYELPDFSLPDPEENDNLIILFMADQQSGLIKGLKYAEQHFLSKDITSMTAEQLEHFIKKLNSLTAYGLTALTTGGALAGQYTTGRIMIVKETGHPSLKYVGESGGYSSHNYKILKKLYGTEAAENYKDLWEKVVEKARGMFLPKNDTLEEIYLKKKVFVIDTIEDSELRQHPGYDMLKKTYAFTASPEQMPQLMKNFCRTLIELIQNKETPTKIAAYALEVTKIHPFMNGNGRVGRILANVILMSYGIPPINFDENKTDYYLAIESEKGQHAIEVYVENKVASQKNTLLDLSRYAISLPEDDKKVSAFKYKNKMVYQNPWGELDLIEENNSADYLWAAGLIKSKEEAEKKRGIPLELKIEMMQAKLRFGMDIEAKMSQVSKTLDGEYCFLKGHHYKETDPQVAIYHFMKAADMYRHNTQDIKHRATCYFEAAKLCKKIHKFEEAYELANKAIKCHIKYNEKEDEEWLKQVQALKNELAFLPKAKEEKAFSANRCSATLWKPSVPQKLLDKYKLTDDSQLQLEKGLRNAASSGDEKDLRVFLKYTHNVNAADQGEYKRTALHWAVIRNHKGCVEILVKAGADCNVKDANKASKDVGYTPLQYAKVHKYDDIISLLVSTGPSAGSPLKKGV